MHINGAEGICGVDWAEGGQLLILILSLATSSEWLYMVSKQVL